MPIDVASSIKFTATDTEPTSDKGRIYYDDSESKLKRYDGNNWGKVSSDLTWGITPGYGPYTADDNTKLLIHSDTSNGSETFYDSSHLSRNVSRIGATHTTGYAKVGASSIDLTAGSHYLYVSDSNDWHFGGDDDYTIDFWVNLASSNGEYRFIGQYDTQWKFWRIEKRAHNDTAGEILYRRDYGTENATTTESSHGTSEITGLTWIDNTWYHIALVKSSDGSGTLRFFRDGTLLATRTNHNPTLTNMGGNLEIGRQGMSSAVNGRMDEIRISNVARWTADFTVY